MNKILATILAILAIMFFMHTFSTETETLNISRLSDWSFQYNNSSNDYSLFFSISDDKDKPIETELDVKMRIVNSNNQEVYNASKKVEKSDYGYYKSLLTEEKHLANVKIAYPEIEKGSAKDGIIYFTIYKDGVKVFEECECKISSHLPIKDTTLKIEILPAEMIIKDYNNSVQSKIVVEDMVYKFESGYIPYLDITLLGEKTYGKDASYDMLRYKLLDSEGYVVDDGTIFLSNLSEGDKFKDNSLKIYDIIPGEKYTLELAGYSMY